MPIAQDMKNITEGIEISYGERMSWLADAIKDTHQMMSRIHGENNRIHGENKETTDAVAQLLALFRGDHKAMAKTMLADIQSRQREREEEVANILSKFAQEMKEMATQLKKFLSHSEGTRLEEFKSMLAAIKSRQRNREEEIAGLLSEYEKDIKEAHAHWQNLAKIMASKRTGRRVPITEVPKKAHVAKRVEKAAQEAFGEGDLKARTWTTIEANPQGISLGQIGKELKVPYIRLAKSIRELVEKGKVAKRDSQYFPA